MQRTVRRSTRQARPVVASPEVRRSSWTFERVLWILVIMIPVAFVSVLLPEGPALLVLALIGGYVVYRSGVRW